VARLVARLKIQADIEAAAEEEARAAAEERIRPFQVFIRTPSFKGNMVYDVNAAMEIRELMRLVELKEKIPASEHWLVFGGKRLEERATVEQCGITSCSTLSVLVTPLLQPSAPMLITVKKLKPNLEQFDRGECSVALKLLKGKESYQRKSPAASLDPWPKIWTDPALQVPAALPLMRKREEKKEEEKKSQPAKDAALNSELTLLQKSNFRRTAEICTRKAERKAIDEANTTAISPSGSWYLIDAKWLRRWRTYTAEGSTTPSPGPISNEALLEPDGTLKKGLQKVKHYRGVNEACWKIFREYHGGGPVIERQGEIELYSEGGALELEDAATTGMGAPRRMEDGWHTTPPPDPYGEPRRCLCGPCA